MDAIERQFAEWLLANAGNEGADQPLNAVMPPPEGDPIVAVRANARYKARDFAKRHRLDDDRPKSVRVDPYVRRKPLQ